MGVDFDQEISRENTAAEKWDSRIDHFGARDVIPLWVADMDFPVPEAVTQALIKRAQHPIYGYTLAQENTFEALRGWLNKRYSWNVPREWITLAPGVVPSIYAALHAFTKPGDGVIVQTPVYRHHFISVTNLERRLILNPLRSENGRYVMDFDQLEQCGAGGARLLILCSPHNPVGRVWSTDELRKLLAICRKHKIVILSDEIFSDLIYPGSKHIPLMTLATEADAVVTAVSPGKTFNLSGMALSALIAPNPDHRAVLKRAFGLLHFDDVSCVNPFSIAAFEAAYREGAVWLDELMRTLLKTRDHAIKYFAERMLPPLRCSSPREPICSGSIAVA